MEGKWKNQVGYFLSTDSTNSERLVGWLVGCVSSCTYMYKLRQVCLCVCGLGHLFFFWADIRLDNEKLQTFKIATHFVFVGIYDVIKTVMFRIQ